MFRWPFGSVQWSVFDINAERKEREGGEKKGEVKKNRKCHARIDVNVRDGIKRTDKNGLYVCIDVCAKDEMRDL